MKTISYILLYCLVSVNSLAQTYTFQAYQDSLKQLFNTSTDIAQKLAAGNEIGGRYLYSYPDSAIHYAQKTVALAKDHSYFNEQIWAMAIMAEGYMNKANLPKTLEISLEVLDLTQHMRDADLFLGPTFYNLSDLYFQIGDLEKARLYARASIDDPRLKTEMLNEAFGYFLLAQVLEKENKPDSAMYFLDLSFEQFNKHHDEFFRKVYGENAWPGLYNLRAKINLQLNKPEEALKDLGKVLTISRSSDEPFHSTNVYNDLALFYKKYERPDSSIHYALKALEEAGKISYDRGKILSLEILSREYELTDPAKALYYYKLADQSRNNLYGSGNIQILRELVTNQEQRGKELALAKKDWQNRVRLYVLLFGLISLLVVAYLLHRNNRSKLRANEILQKQKADIEHTLSLLKSTQAQLIQSEKMASLGELTAGIAHEIQNPLNFVNNFSEVSAELVDEMKSGLQKGDVQASLTIADDLQQNLEKISHHGKRADAIVKGMLEHSRAGSGERAPTDINALADEYLRLAFQGLRAKDKHFNADLKTNFNTNIGLINIIPQDIGRVILNLINNALYAVNERSKKGDPGYNPVVTVTTLKKGECLEIRVEDNGVGIPEAIKDKIFQPFFTTKPTGQGTGLGLSLSYDIVKAHGGTVEVSSTEGVGTLFTVRLPV